MTPAGSSAHAALPSISWQTWLAMVWFLGACVLLVELGIGQVRALRTLRRARAVTDPLWLKLLAEGVRRTGCRRRLRLLASSEVEVPATVGVLRPVILVPNHADTWPLDRRRAVLLHEIVHVARFDWATRTMARFARAVYWFNPLAWWAVRRLDLEQELACDEEVLALGTRASTYAYHLLGIAHGVLLGPAPASAGIEMARRTHLEERIMTILKTTVHRRIHPAVLLPAVIVMAAMVPALAAVDFSNEPRPASNELKEIIVEMQQIEDKLEPNLQQLEDLELELQPTIEAIQDVQIDIDQEKLQEIQEKMQPYIDRMEAIEIDMKPYEQQIQELEYKIQNLVIHVDDGTVEEIEHQIQEQVSKQMEAMESIHVDLEPLMRQIEAIQAEMEPLHKELEAVHIQMEPVHEQLENLHLDMEPIHEQMEAVQKAMEPLHEELERLGDRFERAVGGEIESVLRERLGPVTAPGAPIDEAAARIAEDAHINVDDDVIRVQVSRSEAQEILTDLLAPHRIGTEDAFNAAVAAAADALSPLVIRID
jgi:beta-lactamase regulating signal transducer with metallopeptidase domain/predicted  nucleic acid-binding Zn-ribbon protein